MNQPSNTANTALQPYGQQTQPFVPPPIKRPGATAAKVWGILLLIFGVIGVIQLASSLAMVLSGFTGAEMVPGLDEQTKKELDEFYRSMIDDTLGRWTFWVYVATELGIALVSVWAGVRLAIRPKASGRKLAMARAIAVLMFLPIYGYENVSALDSVAEQQQNMMRSMNDRTIRENAGNASEKDIQRQQQEARRVMDELEPVMKGLNYGMVIFFVICILVVNGLLLLFISKPAVKEYLEGVEREGDHAIPQFDPSMGLMMGPPPGGHDPPKTTGSPPQDKPL